jgi:glycosyltransferase involved in cell wall biosynthesis
LSQIETYDLLLLVTEWSQEDYDRLLQFDAKLRGVVLMGFTPSEQLKDALNGWPNTPNKGEQIIRDSLANENLYIFADGGWQLEWLKKNIESKAKYGIALGGVNPRMFQPSAERVRAVTIGASGDKRDRKGLDTVLAAAKLITEKHPHLTLRTYAGNVPTQKDLVRFYQETTIFLDGHRRGGWCNPVLEAMACGCAVVCTEIGATSFVVNGVNGRTVPQDDSKAMADRALWYLGDENRIRKTSVNARQTAEMLDYRIKAGQLIGFVEKELS